MLNNLWHLLSLEICIIHTLKSRMIFPGDRSSLEKGMVRQAGVIGMLYLALATKSLKSERGVEG